MDLRLAPVKGPDPCRNEFLYCFKGSAAGLAIRAREGGSERGREFLRRPPAGGLAAVLGAGEVS